MAVKKNKPVVSGIAANNIVSQPVTQEVSKSYLEYAMSVVYGRAIPSVVDGFKPVQRRILFSMFEEGFLPEKNYVKSAKPVSTTMGGYHPHGDTGIYEALVKMAQPFYMRMPLIEGYGNFGDVTGSGAAASRYTECRLDPIALQLLSELKEDAVPMRDNYSGDQKEPVYLPTRFPNLIINGNMGIAVGFACKFALHNPTEVMNAAKYLLKNPDATLERIMKYIPGPDFPTGAKIIGMDGILQAYKTGNGKIKLQSKYHINDKGRGKSEIVFTELPYQTKTDKILEKISEGIKNGNLLGIADAKDLTDRNNGLMFTVEVKKGFTPESIVNALFKYTMLEETFGINNIALVDGEPKSVGLIEMFEHFISHRKEIVTARTKNLLKKRQDRSHLVEGLIQALANIDEVIRIIRGSKDSATAQSGLMKKFKIDDIQANYILSIALRRLTKFDQIELEAENKALKDEIEYLLSIINDESVLVEVISKELDATKKIIASDRRSEIVGINLDDYMKETKQLVAQSSVEIKDEPCVVSLSTGGQLVRNAKPARGAVATVETTTRGRFGIVTNKGRMFRVDTLHVGEKASKAEAVLPTSLERGERILTITPVELSKDNVGGIAMGTRSGVVKIQNPSGFPKTQDEYSVFTLTDGDEILGARWVEDTSKYDFVFINSNTNMLRMNASTVRPQGALTGTGVAGFKFDPATEEILDFCVVSHEEIEAGALVVSVADTGNAKFTPLSEYPTKGRGTGGVRTLKFLKGDNKLAYSTIVVGAPKLKTADGETLEALPVDMRRDGSGKPLGGVPVKG